MIVDLHNHTSLCRHANGSPREYVKKAVETGIKYFGFSDHAPMKFDERYRMSFKDMDIYAANVQEVQEEFKGQIEILFAYEVDFLSSFIDSRVMREDVDYFIGSVHFLNGWGFDNPEFIGEYKNKNIDEIWRKYFGAIELWRIVSFLISWDIWTC
jgi:histidinol-phosphatase (PHP family)